MDHAVAQEHARAERQAQQDRLVAGLARLADFFDGPASPEVGATATDELLTLLGAKRRQE